MFCKNCGNPIDPGAAICVKCGFAKGTGTNFCHNCGNALTPGAAFCTRCGYAVNSAPKAANDPISAFLAGPKSKLIAGLLGIFLGGWGVHNFYLGFTKKGVIQLVLWVGGGLITCGLASLAAGIWGLIEGVQILTGEIKVDANGQPLGE